MTSHIDQSEFPAAQSDQFFWNQNQTHEASVPLVQGPEQLEASERWSSCSELRLCFHPQGEPGTQNPVAGPKGEAGNPGLPVKLTDAVLLFVTVTTCQLTLDL